MGDDLAQPHIPPTETNHKGAVLGRTKTTEPTGFTPGEQHPEQRPQQFGRYLEKMFLSSDCNFFLLLFYQNRFYF
ncbi:hypothetical protein GBA52_002332 [Prunus armeniaca]|nr:hypothetical protein GBA52_002332 [Prunus armeniaca]